MTENKLLGWTSVTEECVDIFPEEIDQPTKKIFFSAYESSKTSFSENVDFEPVNLIQIGLYNISSL